MSEVTKVYVTITSKPIAIAAMENLPAITTAISVIELDDTATQMLHAAIDFLGMGDGED